MSFVVIGRRLIFGVTRKIINLPSCKRWCIEEWPDSWAVIVIETTDGIKRYPIEEIEGGNFRVAFDCEFSPVNDATSKITKEGATISRLEYTSQTIAKRNAP